MSRSRARTPPLRIQRQTISRCSGQPRRTRFFFRTGRLVPFAGGLTGLDPSRCTCVRLFDVSSSFQKTKTGPPREIVVIGAGATGGWAAHRLTAQGFHVVLVDAGPVRRKPAPPVDATFRIDVEARRRRQVVPSKQAIQSQCYAYSRETSDIFVDDTEHPYLTPPERPFRWIRCRVVGGRTLLWNRASWRLTDEVFKAASSDGFGADWPIEYQDLAPYYSEVERFLRIRGGNQDPETGQLGDNDASRPFTQHELAFKHAVESRWPDRRVMLERHVPIDTSANAAIGKPFHASVGSTIEAALATHRLKLVPDMTVAHLHFDRTINRVTHAICRDSRSGAERELPGRIFILCASTLESTRILLNSACEEYPNGLCNRSGTLGRYLFDHTFGVFALGISSRPPVSSRGENGLYIANVRHGSPASEPSFVRSYGIQVDVGFPLSEKGAGASRSGCMLHALGEVLPRYENRVYLGRSTDKLGIPVLTIDCTYGRNEDLMTADQYTTMCEILATTDFSLVAGRSSCDPPGSSMHELGTARMGTDPRSSVLNSTNQAWDIPNVFVVDGASFVSGGFQNPTLTMMALAARATDAVVGGIARGMF